MKKAKPRPPRVNLEIEPDLYNDFKGALFAAGYKTIKAALPDALRDFIAKHSKK